MLNVIHEWRIVMQFFLSAIHVSDAKRISLKFVVLVLIFSIISLPLFSV